MLIPKLEEGHIKRNVSGIEASVRIHIGEEGIEMADVICLLQLEAIVYFVLL